MNKFYGTAMFLLLGVVLVSSGRVGAQPGDGDAKETKEKKDYRTPLPFYYGKLGVSDEQRDQMYAYQDAYDAKVAPLIEQIKALKAERDQKMEALLTAGQKLRLKELKAEAEKRSAEREKANEKEEAEAAADAIKPE